MSRRTLRNIGVGFCVFCILSLLVAVERYQANASAVAAMNRLVPSSPSGPIEPMKAGVPDTTTYAVLLGVLSAAGAVVCSVKVRSKDERSHPS